MIKLLDRADIFRSFAGVPVVIVADGKYSMAMEQWIREIAPLWRKHVNMIKYGEKYDCDDYAMEFKLFCQHMHYESPLSTNDGLAVGILHYASDTGGGHAINWAICENGIIYIEPQTGEIKCLSDSELRSRFFVYA